MITCQQPDQEQIDAYLDMLAGQRRLSDHTVSNYRRDLDQLLALADSTALTQLSEADIRRFVAVLHSQGLNPRSISRKLSAWRGFYHWLLEQSITAVNPVESIHAPKKSKPLPKALTVDDAVRLVTASSPKEQTAEKEHPASILCDQAMFELLYSSGLRVSELTGLDIHAVNTQDYRSIGWLNLDEKEITVTGKGSKTRAVPIGEAAVAALEKWLAVRKNLLKADSPADSQYALFLNTRGRRMSPRMVQLRLKAHAEQLGLPMHVHPHMLRHSFASHILQSSGDLRAVQEMLGHASIGSTQIYTSLDFQHLAQVYDAAHPHAKKK
ncbi:MAG: tyrosine recombinase XerC [Oxalobacter sp.]|nr:tyrosine recombinase XerC [Oxalobacter sp.]